MYFFFSRFSGLFDNDNCNSAGETIQHSQTAARVDGGTSTSHNGRQG